MPIESYIFVGLRISSSSSVAGGSVRDTVLYSRSRGSSSSSVRDEFRATDRPPRPGGGDKNGIAFALPSKSQPIPEFYPVVGSIQGARTLLSVRRPVRLPLSGVASGTRARCRKCFQPTARRRNGVVQRYAQFSRSSRFSLLPDNVRVEDNE